MTIFEQGNSGIPNRCSSCRLDEDETTGIVGRILSGRRFHYREVVDLITRNHVERESSRIGLTAWNGSSVDPYIIITLRETTDHDEFLVDEAHAWHTAYHLARIGVLGALYFLCRHIAHYDGTRLGLLDHRFLCVSPCNSGDGDLTELLFIRLKCYKHLIPGTISLRLNSVNFLSLIRYVFHHQRILAVRGKGGELESTVNVSNSAVGRPGHLYRCADDWLARALIDDLSLNFLSHRTQRTGRQQSEGKHNLT